MKKTIMVVDDEPDFLDVMKDVLSLRGYDVETASGGEDAIDQIHENQPNLVLLDVNMPGMDGFDVLFRLKNSYKTSALPVVMLSGYGQTSNIMRAQQMRASDYVTKPFNEDELLRLIKRYEK